MVTLAHLSDVHLSPLPPVRPQDLLNKRITGFVNWHLNRAKHMHGDTFSRLIAHLQAQKPDFTVVTGDLVNLALDEEFNRAAQWLRKFDTFEKVCVIPGNHDAYVPGALEKFQQYMGRYAAGETVEDARYPYVRRIGDIAIIACSSAIATPPFMAYGAFDQPQADRLNKTLDILGKAGFFRVVTIHHPPNREFASEKRRGLRGAKLFRDVIAESGAELILHGHLHRSTINALDSKHGEVPVVGVAAASADAGSGEDPARYNLFDLERVGSKWSCTQREYGYQRIGDEIVMRLQMRIY